MKAYSDVVQPALMLAALAFVGITIQYAQAGVWITNSPMITGRYGHAATRLTNGHALVVGGSTSTGETASAELFDSATGYWTNTSAMHDARIAPTATLLANGKVLVTGGIGTTEVLSSTELYNPDTGMWETNNALNASRQGHTATLLFDGRVLVAGGLDDVLPDGTELSSAETYNPITTTWTTTGSLTNARWGHTATRLADGRVLVAGGVGSNGLSSSAELFDPDLGIWTPTAPMAAARRLHTATLLPSGKVLVAGGAGDTNDIPIAELYNPSTGTWTPAGSLNFPRNSHTASLMPNGTVLIAGGWPFSGGWANAAEIYEPNTEAWTMTAKLNIARAFHSASLLPNGVVLVTGGFGDGGKLSSTEFYVETVPFHLTNPVILPSGAFQFGFTNQSGLGFNVLVTTNPSLVLGNWTLLGEVPEISAGQFQFIDPQATNFPQRFYRVRAN